MKCIISFLCILSGLNIKVTAQESDAAKEILSKILKAEFALKQNKELNQEDLSQIICLTNIGTKNGNGDYNGIVSLPSESEIQVWKDWYELNKTKISYSVDSNIYEKEVFEGKQKVIQVEFETGKYRNSVCDDDKYFQNWWPEWNSKKKRSH